MKIKTKYKQTKICELVEQTVGGTWGPESDETKGIPVLRSTNFTKDQKIVFENIAYRDITDAKLTNRILKNGDILIEISGGGPSQPVGRALEFINPDGKTYTYGNFVRRLKLNSDLLTQEYLSLALKALYIFGETEPIQTNTTNLRNLNFKDYINLEIPVPTIQEQKQIVSKIKECFTLLDKSEAKLRFAEEKLDKVMDSAIVKYIEEEGKNKEWDFKSIKDICEINPSKTEIKELPLDTKVAFVQMSSVSDKTGTIEIQEIRTLEEVKKGYTYFKKGDIIFAKITPCMENGKTSLTDNLETKYGFGSTEFHVLRVNNHKILPEYLYIILRSQRFRKLAMTNMTGTAGQKRLPKDYLAEYKIYVPSIEEQKNIVTKLHKIEAERTNYNSIYEKSLSRLSNLRQSILKKAFEGKLI